MVLVNQKLEVVDGTYQVFKDFQDNFVSWVFDIFSKNSEIAFKKKSNSFLLFKEQMILLKSNYNYFQLMSSFYFRLKNLVLDELPKLRLIPVKDKSG